jgi:hypothetical protein
MGRQMIARLHLPGKGLAGLKSRLKKKLGGINYQVTTISSNG